MSTPDLTGKRVLILGAETEIGRAVTTAVAEAGASVAAVATTSNAEAAFAVQRQARRLSSGERKVIAQAIDATNEAAVRVMVRQVSKELGGLDAVVFCGEPTGTVDITERRERMRYAALGGSAKELARTRGQFVMAIPTVLRPPGLPSKPAGGFRTLKPAPGLEVAIVGTEGKSREALIADIIGAIAGEADSG